MSQTTNFQIRLTPDELMTLNFRAVTLTAANKKPYSLQDVVREWIEYGCHINSRKQQPKHGFKNARRNKKTK